MPWKGEKDPYKVWLSEIILQQTRVEQGWGYFERFIRQYPVIQALAKAKDEDVFKLWEGLGYYNRCKNLLATARKIVAEYNGIFPGDYNSIIALKGIGPYTAAAISSFCFDLPYPVVDGNVIRVLSRVFAIETPVDNSNAKEIFTSLAEKLIYRPDAAGFNQAIMDFGATICKPALPMCGSCYLQKICGAYKAGKVNILPIKQKTLLRKTRWLTYFIFNHRSNTLIHKRTGKDIWQNLFEFYLVETADNPKWDKNVVHTWLRGQFGISNNPGTEIFAGRKQQLTHQEIKGYFIHVKLTVIPPSLKAPGLLWLSTTEAAQLPFPRFINHHLHKNSSQPELFNC
jgi:A/G-specific adenine glycosylase